MQHNMEESILLQATVQTCYHVFLLENEEIANKT